MGDGAGREAGGEEGKLSTASRASPGFRRGVTALGEAQ